MDFQQIGNKLFLYAMSSFSLYDIPKDVLYYHILPSLCKEERYIIQTTSLWFKEKAEYKKLDICSFAALEGHLELLQ